MAEICQSIQFSADPVLYSGDALVLDTWLELGQVNLTSAAPVLYGYDVPVIVGGSGGNPPVGPSAEP